MDTKLIKDHVSGYGKNSREATNKHFGINNSLIIRAVKGDDKALTTISEMGQTGERLTTVVPTIKEKLKQYINGITQYNQAVSEIYQAGSAGSSTITQAGGSLSLSEQKYNNNIEEYKYRLLQQQASEGIRHNDEMAMIKLQAWVDRNRQTVDSKARFEGTSNQPMIAQIKADKDYESKRIQHQLEYGDKSDLRLIPKKQYNNDLMSKVWTGVREFFS